MIWQVNWLNSSYWPILNLHAIFVRLSSALDIRVFLNINPNVSCLSKVGKSLKTERKLRCTCSDGRGGRGCNLSERLALRSCALKTVGFVFIVHPNDQAASATGQLGRRNRSTRNEKTENI